MMRLHCLRDYPQFRTDPNDTRRTFDYMVSVDAVLRLLRPLSEGLALFAEYDMAPGASAVCSKPMVWAIVALSDREQALDPSDPSSAAVLAQRLLDTRLTPNSLERKMAFLSVPAMELERAYFDGYLLVKRLLADLGQAVPAFHDTDLFLHFLRSYFFEDSGLVSLLLAPELDPVRRVRSVIARFETRLAMLDDDGLAAAVAAYETANGGPPNDQSWPNRSGLLLTDPEMEAEKERLEYFLAEIADNERLSEPHRRLLAAQRILMERRSLAYMAAEPAEIQVRNGVLTAWPVPRDFDFPAITGGMADRDVADTPGPVSGWITAVFRPATSDIAILIGRDKDVFKTIHPTPGVPDPDWVELITHPLCSPVFVQEEFEQTRAWADDYFDRMPDPLRRVVEMARLEVDQCLERISGRTFERWRSHRGNGDREAEAFARARNEHSLWHLYAGSRPMFETCLVLGILRGHDVLLPSVHQNLLSHGWDSWKALEFAVATSSSSGFAMVRNCDGVFRWLV